MRLFTLLCLLLCISAIPQAQAEWRQQPASEKVERSDSRSFSQVLFSVKKQMEIKPYYGFLLVMIGIALLISGLAFLLINVSLVVGLLISAFLAIGFIGGILSGELGSALGVLACFAVAIITTISVRANPWNGIGIAIAVLAILIMSLIFTAPFR